MTRGLNSPDLIVVSANGAAAAWAPEFGFTGMGTLPRKATTAAHGGFLVRLHPMGPEETADATTPLGAFAALQWAAGGRGLLVEGPPALYGYLDALSDDTDLVEPTPAGFIDSLPEDVMP